MAKEKGSFTLPGEAGYEKLTLELAEKWGADVIRDSDGTVLSDEITKAGYGIYSTICIIRDHNEWAKQHMNMLQQSFLMTTPVMAEKEELKICLMDGYFKEQFAVNDSEDSLRYWEVFDRTSNKIIKSWHYDKESGCVEIRNAELFHNYTVNFLAYRLWEEISMYNHVTNNWDKEHLMPIDPREKKAQEYLYNWLENWCKNHPDTTVVRFTSLFYNFVWIWGSSEKNRNLYSDWASYDFTVSPKALDDFEKEYGYKLTSEDFINKGNLHVTHMPPNSKQLDYMKFTNRFVVDFGKKLIELVHSYGKQAYVFYDDSWVGVEPYSDLFKEFNFDGLIKCVFSGYEARLCAGVTVDTHELRLHPYLFPVGLGGAPTFAEGGNPTLDAKNYWISIRRALLREGVDRLGLGGYLHLTEDFPDFCDYIEELMDEFREIKKLHADGEVYTLPITVAVLHSWGSLRSWSLSGHFHETYMHTLIHINEALSGLPVNVKFINFEDVKNGKLADVDVVINAGCAMDAWSGGDNWKDEASIVEIRKWAYSGGVVIGVKEPSAVNGYDHFYRLYDILGVDKDTGEKVCHGKWQFEVDKALGDKLIPVDASVKPLEKVFITNPDTKVIAANGDEPLIAIHDFGKGKGIYLSDFEKTNADIRLLLNLLLYSKNMELTSNYITDNKDAECAYYPKSNKLVVINNSDREISTSVNIETGKREFTLKPFETQIVKLD